MGQQRLRGSWLMIPLGGLIGLIVATCSGPPSQFDSLPAPPTSIQGTQ